MNVTREDTKRCLALIAEKLNMTGAEYERFVDKDFCKHAEEAEKKDRRYYLSLMRYTLDDPKRKEFFDECLEQCVRIHAEVRERKEAAK